MIIFSFTHSTLNYTVVIFQSLMPKLIVWKARVLNGFLTIYLHVGWFKVWVRPKVTATIYVTLTTAFVVGGKRVVESQYSWQLLKADKNLFTSPSPFYMIRRDANAKFVRPNSFFYVSGVLFKSVYVFQFFRSWFTVELLIKIVMVSFVTSKLKRLICFKQTSLARSVEITVLIFLDKSIYVRFDN